MGRHLDEDYLDRVRSYHATEPYAKAMRKRQVWVASQRVPGFAEAKDWHGLRRFRLRGLESSSRRPRTCQFRRHNSGAPFAPFGRLHVRAPHVPFLNSLGRF